MEGTLHYTKAADICEYAETIACLCEILQLYLEASCCSAKQIWLQTEENEGNEKE